MSEAAAQAFIFFVAGHETASNALQFCLFELAINPDVQSKLRQEVDKALAKTNGTFTYETIQELTYLDQVISGRCTAKGSPCVIAGLYIPFSNSNINLVLHI